MPRHAIRNFVELFNEYRPSSRRAPGHVRFTLGMGAVAAAIAALFLLAEPRPIGMLSLSLFGVSAGLMILFFGCWELRHASGRMTGPGQALARTLDSWFPPLMYVLQYLFPSLIVLLIWGALAAEGFAENPHQLVLILLIVLFSALRRFINAAIGSDRRPALDILQESLGTLSLIAVCILAAGFLSALLFPPSTRRPDEIPYGLVAVWVPAILVMLAGLILLLDRILRLRKPEKVWDEPPDDEDEEELEEGATGGKP